MKVNFYKNIWHTYKLQNKNDIYFDTFFGTLRLKSTEDLKTKT